MVDDAHQFVTVRKIHNASTSRQGNLLRHEFQPIGQYG
ncbi:hypothetical protein AZ16_3563 [Bordetella bronchiseptica B18-5 (C3)]|nr:hypothetical protein AZ16_3563 [Bordetella bronchiseptica B18-5 (C3)]